MTLPNFIIGGAPRSGTTSLYGYLREHPEVYLSPIKEPRYFLVDPDYQNNSSTNGFSIPIQTLDHYSALFDGVRTEKAIGEATPFYMNSATALRSISQLLPDVRLIFCLREPIARAYSAYWLSIRFSEDPRPVEEVLSETSTFVIGGRYYSSLVNWYERFSSSQIHVILFDDLVAEPLQVFQALCRFLGIDDAFVPDLTNRNKGGAPKSRAAARIIDYLTQRGVHRAIKPYVPSRFRSMLRGARDANFEKPPSISPKLVQKLSAFYADDIAQLEVLLGRDLSAWKHA